MKKHLGQSVLMCLVGHCAATHRDMAIHVTLQSAGQVEHLGFQALQDLLTENEKSDYQYLLTYLNKNGPKYQ